LAPFFPFFFRHDDRQIRAEDHAVLTLGALILVDDNRRPVALLIQCFGRLKDLFLADIEADPAFLSAFA
jgi:hypothetical protein